jgi:hypothetical protein
MKSLQIGSPDVIRLVAVLPGDRSLERQIQPRQVRRRVFQTWSGVGFPGEHRPMSGFRKDINPAVAPETAAPPPPEPPRRLSLRDLRAAALARKASAAADRSPPACGCAHPKVRQHGVPILGRFPRRIRHRQLRHIGLAQSKYRHLKITSRGDALPARSRMGVASPRPRAALKRRARAFEDYVSDLIGLEQPLSDQLSNIAALDCHLFGARSACAVDGWLTKAKSQPQNERSKSLLSC